MKTIGLVNSYKGTGLISHQFSLSIVFVRMNGGGDAGTTKMCQCVCVCVMIEMNYLNGYEIAEVSFRLHHVIGHQIDEFIVQKTSLVFHFELLLFGFVCEQFGIFFQCICPITAYGWRWWCVIVIPGRRS